MNSGRAMPYYCFTLRATTLIKLDNDLGQANGAVVVITGPS
ncbi:MAG: hypothetical protein OFPI_24290 [Osedax symbiont Rs2]|nr:MAG: hypothetical protein OFPI_24290 [Osedax symbiont Rs2]